MTSVYNSPLLETEGGGTRGGGGVPDKDTSSATVSPNVELSNNFPIGGSGVNQVSRQSCSSLSLLMERPLQVVALH